MSKTEMKNGARVYNAAKSVALSKTSPWWLYFTIGEVAKEANCSKPTVRKYLKVMAEMEICREVVAPHMPPKTTKLFKWTEVLA